MPVPEVSVVIPCYNAARYVLATVQAVLAQAAGVSLEVIVVDDGSRDDSVARLRASGLPVHIVEQANAGVATARNRGAAHARGQWLAFCDADDLWLPGKLTRQLGALARFPQARMASAAWHVWVDDAPAPPTLAAWCPEGGVGLALDDSLVCDDRYPALLEDCVVWTSTVVMQRSLFEEAGGFDASLPVGEDYDLWLRCSRLTPMLMDMQPLALYRMHAGSITKRALPRNYKGEVVGRAIERWGHAGAFGGHADAARVARGLARSWADHAGSAYRAGQAPQAREAALKSLRLQPAQWLGWTVLAKSCLRPRASLGMGSGR
jgi:glycosyltransferase involved in cell wall biosynthesis